MDAFLSSDRVESDGESENVFKRIITVDQGFTETDDSDSSEKENRKSSRKPKATRQQFCKLDAFMNGKF